MVARIDHSGVFWTTTNIGVTGGIAATFINAQSISATVAVGATTVQANGALWLSPGTTLSAGYGAPITGAPGGSIYQPLYIRQSDQVVFLGPTTSSSIKTKRNVAPAVVKKDVYKAVEVVQFRYRPEAVSDPLHAQRLKYGFIAEQLEEAGLAAVIDYDSEGEPVDVDTRQLLALLYLTVQDLGTRLEALEARL
jgi:hypothetical protein